jgi:hypothetical protein
MSKLRVSAFFCEDIRIESSGQPMYIGVLSPVLSIGEDPVIAADLIFVTMFFVDPDVEEFEADLRIDAVGYPEEDNDDYPFKVSKKFRKKPEMGDDDEWMVVSHLDMSGVTLKSGMKISAQLKAFDYEETINLRVK